MKFWGYRRPDGRVGTRNHVLILATVGCAAETARLAAEGLCGAVSFVNQNGCGESSKNLRRTRDVLIGLAAHPNVYGVVAIGLGCEINRMDDFLAELKARTDKPVEALLIQEEGGTIETVAKAKKIARRMIIEASMCRREECDLSELILGVECGGSDATSGLVSNPVMGLVSDRVVAEGGTAMFSETVEMIGAEHILARRAATPEVGQKILDYVRFREDEQIAAGEDVRKTQPSPGNKDGGITTLEEKSLGCIHKGGHTPVVDMIDCAHAPTKKGLVLMDTPCYDMLSVTAKAAGGAQLIVFTTGRGNAIGNPVVPVMKVTANGDTYRKLSDNIDLDMSPVLERDMSLEEMADITLRQIVDTLSGRLTSAEVLKLGYSETIISRACEYC
ncbi:MAG TPA: UxaA family hydrolase [Candidatus Scatomorpha gallistercoris]|nr:UxaA family hydrolase [Candidatus Scatomorpha gallistercoris]